MTAHAHEHHDAAGHHAGHHEEAGHHDAAGPHDPKGTVKLYVTIFVALLVLTAATVAASYVELGRWHVPVAIGIAVFKALLVLLFFMHLLGGSRLQWLVVAAAGCFATIFVSLVGADYASRNWYLPTPTPLEVREWQPAELPPASKAAPSPAATGEATRAAAAPSETVSPEASP